MKKTIVSFLAVLLGVGLFGGMAFADGESECVGGGKVWHDESCMDAKYYCESVVHGTLDNGLCVIKDLQAGTLLPDNNAGISFEDCQGMFHKASGNSTELREVFTKNKPFTYKNKAFGEQDVLACGIRTGDISLWMIPFYIKYFIQFALTIAGLIAVFSLIVGGYFYLFGGMASDKDKGKNAIVYGLLGFVVAMLSWAIVNVVVSALTR